MQKKGAKRAAIRSAHDDYDLPREVDFNKAKFIGFGIGALERHARQKLTVELDADVASVFDSAKSVNTVLRAIIEGLAATKKRRKSA